MDETRELSRTAVTGADEDVVAAAYTYTWTEPHTSEPLSYTKITLWAGGTDRDYANDRIERLPAELDPEDYPKFRAALIEALDNAARAAGWKPDTEYIALYGQAWLNEHGSGVNYYWDRKKFPTRQAAIDHGFTLGRSDDFNIGTIAGGKLTAVGWMEQDHDNPAETLARIAAECYIDTP